MDDNDVGSRREAPAVQANRLTVSWGNECGDAAEESEVPDPPVSSAPASDPNPKIATAVTTASAPIVTATVRPRAQELDVFPPDIVGILVPLRDRILHERT
jgi:hypothetical protein